ncbi:MAG TPA: hypothetical protein DEP87_00950 [Candidatus Pacebacteria bacterium]|nr:hypothetical protein [Candidatus Paceibacterota bacterium]
MLNEGVKFFREIFRRKPVYGLEIRCTIHDIKWRKKRKPTHPNETKDEVLNNIRQEIRARHEFETAGRKGTGGCHGPYDEIEI